MGKEHIYVSEGYRNWSHATDKKKGFCKHEVSTLHQNAYEAWIKRSKIENGSETSIAQKLIPNLATLAADNLKYFTHLFKYIQWFVVNELAMRGRDECDESTYRGKWLSFIAMQLDTNPDFKKLHCEMLKKRHSTDYTSKTTVNEIISTMAKSCRQVIYDEIRKAGCFSVMLDESKDKAKREELAISVRYA